MRAALRITLPLAVLALASVAALVIYQTRPEASPRPRVKPPLLVSTVEVETADVQFTVQSRGRVAPRTQTVLSSEVAGAIVKVADSFEVGAMVPAGTELLQIDPRTYETNVQQARAALARARSQLASEQALADYAEEDYARLEEVGATRLPPSDLTLRRPQLAAAIAEVEAARASLRRATDDMGRTSVRVPVDALIREKRVDLGQYVAPGTPLMVLQAIDRAEIRLPVTLGDLRYLPIEAIDRGERALEVDLHATVGGETRRWSALITRTEGVIDAQSQVMHLIADIEDPYNLMKAGGRPMLRFGTFVAADIRGITARDVIALPRAALDASERIWRIDDDDRIFPVDVEIARRDEETVYLHAELDNGQQISITPVQDPEPGMNVRRRDGAEVGNYTRRSGRPF